MFCQWHLEPTVLSSQFLNLVFLTYRLWNLTKVISLFLMPCLTFFVMISHLMSPSSILLEEQLSKVRRHLSKQSNVHFSHSTPGKDTTVANYTYTVSNTKNTKGRQWQSQTYAQLSVSAPMLISHPWPLPGQNFSVSRNCRFENNYWYFL